MTEIERAHLREHVENWRIVGRVVEDLRHEKVRNTDTAAALAILEDAFASALFLAQPSQTSGLVTQQAIFAKARR